MKSTQNTAFFNINPVIVGKKSLLCISQKLMLYLKKHILELIANKIFVYQNIKLHAIAVYNVGFVESNFSLDCF